MRKTNHFRHFFALLLFVFLETNCTRVGFTSQVSPVSTTSVTHTPSITATILPTSTHIPTVTITLTPPPTQNCFSFIEPVGFLPDNNHLVARSNMGIILINVSGNIIEKEFRVSQGLVKATISSDGQTIALALDDFSIQLMRISDGQVLRTLLGHTSMITGLKFSPSGNKLYSASYDTWIRIWSWDGSLLHAFQSTGADNFPSEVMGIGISPDGKQIATIPSDGPMKLWSLDNDRLLGEFEGSISGGYDGAEVVFSPDGQYIAQHLGAGAGFISVWRLTDQALLYRSDQVSISVAYSPDNRNLAFAEMVPNGLDHIVLRSPDGKVLIKTLEPPEGVSQLGGIVFSPDGRLVAASAQANSRLLIWQVSDGTLIPLLPSICSN
jgi:WD40 repeat protein